MWSMIRTLRFRPELNEGFVGWADSVSESTSEPHPWRVQQNRLLQIVE
jgi:hypothetical protein